VDKLLRARWKDALDRFSTASAGEMEDKHVGEVAGSTVRGYMLKDVREFISVLHGSDLGIFVSKSGFTKPAEDLARSDQRKIRLFDLEKVFDLWVEHYPLIADEHRRLLRLRPVWFLARETEARTVVAWRATRLAINH
jgi:hypothetical protein